MHTRFISIPIKITKTISLMNSTVVSRAAFGKACKDRQRFISVSRDLTSLASGFNLHDLSPSSKIINTITVMRIRLERIHKELVTILDGILNEHEVRRMEKDSA